MKKGHISEPPTKQPDMKPSDPYRAEDIITPALQKIKENYIDG